MKQRSRSDGPVRLSDVALPETPVLRRLAVMAAWRRVVGATLADRSRARPAGDVLEVTVPDERWALALQRMAASILGRLREQTGAEHVRTLEVRIDPSLRVPRQAAPGRADPGG